MKSREQRPILSEEVDVAPPQSTTRKSGGQRQRREVSPEEITALLASSAGLRDGGRELLARVRSSLARLRELRDRDRAPWAGTAGRPGTGDSAQAWLQHRFGLTNREAEVGVLLAEGLSNAAIAAALAVSPHTSRHHTERVLRKLGVHSRAAAGAKLRNSWRL